MLVIDLHALRPVHVLHFIEQIGVKGFLALDAQDVVRDDRAADQRVAGLDIVAGVNLQFLYGRGLFATGGSGGPLYSRTFDAAIYTWIGGDDPQYIGLYGCSGIPTKENNYSGQNDPGWCNKSADDALKQSEQNPDVALSREKRKPPQASQGKSASGKSASSKSSSRSK